MLILDESNKAVIIDNIFAPTVSASFWTLNLEIMDFTLSNIEVLEQVICPSMKVRINGFEFVLPASWNMLVIDEETSQLDVVEVAELAGRDFTSVIYGPDMAYPEYAKVSVIDYSPSHENVHPSMNKFQMLCHPVAPDKWVVISPSDSYNKYLKDKVIGDII